MFVAFDTETTGLDKDQDHLIEIGAYRFDRNGVIGEPFSILIKPPVPLSPFIQNLTHITPQMLQNADDAKTAVKKFLDFIQKDDMLVAHNAPFDLGFVNMALMVHHHTELSNICIDTLPLARWAFPTEEKAPKGTYTLQTLAARFNINVEAAHRAHDDARVCMELLKRIVEDTLDRQKDYKEFLEPPAADLQLDLFN